MGKATKRHAPNGNTTKGNAIDNVETTRFSQRRFATTRNAIKLGSFSTNHNGMGVSTNEYQTNENRRVIPTTNAGDIRNIPTNNDIPTKNNKKGMHWKNADNGKPIERMNAIRIKNTITPTQNSMSTRARAWNAIMKSNGYKKRSTTAM